MSTVQYAFDPLKDWLVKPWNASSLCGETKTIKGAKNGENQFQNKTRNALEPFCGWTSATSTQRLLLWSYTYKTVWMRMEVGCFFVYRLLYYRLDATSVSSKVRLAFFLNMHWHVFVASGRTWLPAIVHICRARSCVPMIPTDRVFNRSHFILFGSLLNLPSPVATEQFDQGCVPSQSFLMALCGDCNPGHHVHELRS